MIVLIASVVIVSLLVWFFIWKAKYVNRLKQIRDDFDLTTPEGRFLINVYNRKINQLNGFYIFKK